jgi:hypothetical protein
MRSRIRKSVVLVVVTAVVAGVLAAVALAGTTSKLPTSSAPAAAAPVLQAGAANPNFLGAVVGFVAGYVATNALNYVVANRVALAAALEASTYTTIVLATPAGPANPADSQFDNTNG